MGNRTATTAPKAYPNPEQTRKNMEDWADRFWNPVFSFKGILPDDLDRKVSRWLTFQALLFIAKERPGQEFTGGDLVMAIQHVSQDPRTLDKFVQWLDEVQA